MKRYAFIDVQNTETTTLKMLGFPLDNKKLFLYLKEKWQCERVFFYPGIQNKDTVREEIFSEISTLGATVRPKFFFVYKNEDRVVSTNCPKCNTKVTQRIDMGNSWKCNCDVDMTIDILDYTKENTEILLFTGDGDFEPLIERVVTRGTKVYLVSSAEKTAVGPRSSISRFSTRLRKLIAKYPEHVLYLNINDWKIRIAQEKK